MENLLQQGEHYITQFGFAFLIALVIFIVGRWVAKIVKSVLEKMMKKKEVDGAVISFTSDLVYTLLIVFVILAALSQLGVETTSFVAIIGAAGLAVGLALQGSLSNFAAGVLIIIFKPFTVGDFIDAGGVTGTVEKIQIFTTILKSPDNKLIICPNTNIMGGNIVNFSAKDTRRVDFVFGIGYGDDIKKAKEVLTKMIEEDSRILKDPAPTIGVVELADSSINIAVRPWVNKADYWNVFFDFNENVKYKFDEANISIPYPQSDVHIITPKD
ncbi:MAG: mechanosensitive ion channel [Melioribacteraceae bacterium]|nr:mechanosensitive ion channel [Melioribacteraceae bacterium]